MSRLFYYLKQYRGLLTAALVLAIINQVFSLLDPLIFRYIIDNVATKFNWQKQPISDFIKALLPLMSAAVGVAFVSRLAKNFQDYYISTITQKIGARLYTDGIEHSLELPYETFEDQRSGETLGKLQKVRTDVEKLISVGINVFFQSMVSLVFITIYAFSVHWIIVPLFLTIGPLIGWVSSKLSKKVKGIQTQIVKESTALAGSTTESLRNIELIKSLGLAKQEINHLNNTTQKILGLELKKVKFVRSMMFVQGTTVNLLRTILSFIMLYLVYKNTITLGQYFSLNFYTFFIFGPLQEMGNVINAYREAQVSLANYEQIFKLEVEQQPAKPYPLEQITDIKFDKVRFRHQSSNKDAIRGIDFSVKKGQTIAFVGPSGSGKSTLIKLLVGLYKPAEGQILFNGHAGHEINYDKLRERIGFVTQDTQLFSGTIRENLLFVNPTATDAQCMKVLEMAACQTLLDRAENGLDTVLGEGGVKVSGGEKQRLSIARALLREPNLLVFDEATSSLDSITEEEITDTIQKIAAAKDHITILIAHRLSTIMHADSIFVLEKGKIIENGTHQSLLNDKGLYYALWRQQVGEKEHSEND
jgi:ATP-binding cassette, subfamily B, bacterial